MTDDSAWDDPNAAYPVVRVVAALSAPLDYPEVISITATRICERFGLAEDAAEELLERARRDSLTLAGSIH